MLAVERDPVALTLRIVAAFDAPTARVWQVWADPRKLERWWGPPGYPATVLEHDLTAGGGVAYSMTGPDGRVRRGKGVLEQLVLGPHAPSGFTGVLAPA